MGIVDTSFERNNRTNEFEKKYRNIIIKVCKQKFSKRSIDIKIIYSCTQINQPLDFSILYTFIHISHENTQLL